MEVLETVGWSDYELIDSGDGYRLERFGKYILSRPDPQIIWKKKLGQDVWGKVDAVFERTQEDKGRWEIKTSIPEKWLIQYGQLSFWAKLTPFKHTGIFPEQHLHWDFIMNMIKNSGRETHILNLFGYTGIASLAAVAAGAKVTHVDASKPSIKWARESQAASHLEDKQIRWINDDAMKFVQREIKRGVKYDGIIMDPPVFGHGPDGSLWKFNESFPKLLAATRQVLSPFPLFIIVNAYALSSSSIMLQNVMEDYFNNLHGAVISGELALQEKSSDRLLSTGIFARWQAK